LSAKIKRKIALSLIRMNAKRREREKEYWKNTGNTHCSSLFRLFFCTIITANLDEWQQKTSEREKEHERSK